MATYNELRSLFNEGSLLLKAEVAVCVKAQAIFAESTPSAGRLSWAETVLGSPHSEAEKMLRYALASNKALTIAQIISVADASLQTAIDTAVDKLHP